MLLEFSENEDESLDDDHENDVLGHHEELTIKVNKEGRDTVIILRLVKFIGEHSAPKAIRNVLLVVIHLAPIKGLFGKFLRKVCEQIGFFEEMLTFGLVEVKQNLVLSVVGQVLLELHYFARDRRVNVHDHVSVVIIDKQTLMVLVAKTLFVLREVLIQVRHQERRVKSFDYVFVPLVL